MPATGLQGRAHGTAVGSLFELAPVPLAVIAADGTISAANSSFGSLFEIPPSALAGTAVTDLLDSPDGCPANPAALRSEQAAARIHRFRRPSGRLFWGRLSIRHVGPDTWPTGGHAAWLVSLEDITESVEGLRFGHDSESRHRNLMTAAPVGIFLTDASGRSTFVNDRWVELTGLSARDGVRDGWMRAVHPDDIELVHTAWTAAVRTRRRFHVEFRLRRSNGDAIWVQSEATAIHGPNGEPEGLLGTMVDITASRQLLERLEQQANHDLLTGLANRAMLVHRLDQANPARRRTAIAVLFCDLDGFKAVNDGLGHDAGDALLITVGERITTAIRSHDTAARFGGDEFVILLENLDPDDAADVAATIAERVVSAVSQPIPVAGTVATVSASVGIVVGRPGSTDDTESLLRSADLAMYQAKLAGKGCWRIFDAELRDRVDARRSLEIELRDGLSSELEVRYAPVFDLTTRRPAGFDAVPWWHHPQRGLLGPTGYLDVAADANLDIELERWVLVQAAEHGASQQQAGEPALPIWIQVSGRNLRRGDFAEFVAATVDESGVDPRRLGISVAQHALGRHTNQVATSLEWLAMIGVRTGIHGFGIEPVSIPQLQDLRVESVLLHHDLLDRLGEDERALVNVAAVAGVARAVGIAVSAAGVATEHQAALLASMGCRTAGGPLFETNPRTPVGAIILSADALAPALASGANG